MISLFHPYHSSLVTLYAWFQSLKKWNSLSWSNNLWSKARQWIIKILFFLYLSKWRCMVRHVSFSKCNYILFRHMVVTCETNILYSCYESSHCVRTFQINSSFQLNGTACHVFEDIFTRMGSKIYLKSWKSHLRFLIMFGVKPKTLE